MINVSNEAASWASPMTIILHFLPHLILAFVISNNISKYYIYIASNNRKIPISATQKPQWFTQHTNKQTNATGLVCDSATPKKTEWIILQHSGYFFDYKDTYINKYSLFVYMLTKFNYYDKLHMWTWGHMRVFIVDWLINGKLIEVNSFTFWFNDWLIQ